MRTLAYNEMIEIVGIDVNGRPHMLHHDRLILDQRGQFLKQLVQAWGSMHLLGDAAKIAQGVAPAPPPEIGKVVAMAADTVEAVYDQAAQRGWTLELPPFKDAT